jgi:hypothetical protein
VEHLDDGLGAAVEASGIDRELRKKCIRGERVCTFAFPLSSIECKFD